MKILDAVSFDVDGLDPVYAPGTGTPEIGGFSTFDAQRMLRGLQGLDLIGADVVEVSPPFDPSGGTALVGATLMFELLCVLADAVEEEAVRAVLVVDGNPLTQRAAREASATRGVRIAGEIPS